MNINISKMSLLKLWIRARPYLAMIFVQCGYAVGGLIVKSALNKGMSHFTFAVYRNAAAAVVFAPFAILLERKIRPKMTLSIFLKIMLLALLEPVLDMNLFFMGMKYTTASFASAMTNMLPAIALFMAWIFRLEKMNIMRLHSQGKILGTLVTVGGAMIMTLVQGPTIAFPWTNSNTLQHESTATVDPHDRVKGSLMITAGIFCWASFIILQAITLKSYPAELSLSCFMCAFGAVQGTILTIVVEKGNSAIWSIQWDVKLIATIYCGLVSSGATYYLSGMVMKERGPVFVTSFSPLNMIVVAVLGSLILAEQMDLGRVVGAIVIVAGLYLVIWGKSKDEFEPNDGQEKSIVNCDDDRKTSKNDLSEKIPADFEAV